MRRSPFLPLLLCAGLAGCGHAPAPSPPVPPPAAGPAAGARQLLLVLTADWDAVPGSLRRFQRSSPSAPWRPVGGVIPVVVGRAGLGWGVGLHGSGPPRAAEPAAAPAGPLKREGDGRAPAGAFELGPAFGYAPAAAVPGLRLPYIRLTGDWKCVDDPRSAQYNRLLDRRTVRQDWQSAEDMAAAGEAYRLGVVVQHDWGAQTQPGAGSCIFLHIWAGPGSSTVGCTAMPADSLRALLGWLDPTRRPVLVQLPRPAYDRLRSTWALPGS
jgi:hypothetical protein